MLRVKARAGVSLLWLVACAGEIHDSSSLAGQGGNSGLQAGRTGAPLPAAGNGGAGRSGAGGVNGAAGVAAVGGGRSAGAGAGGVSAAGRSASAGKSGEAGQAGSGAPTFTEVYEELVFGCNGCHAAGMGGLRMMTQAEAYANLVNTPSRSCSELKRVEPGDPNNSLVYLAITRAGMSGDCKVPSMPPGNIPWQQESVDKIRAWIQAGAKDD